MENKEARKRIQSARTALVLDQPFFGALALRLETREDQCKTSWTDGTTLGYNPEFVNDLGREELIGLIAHEVMHCAAGHPWRKGPREHGKWNQAADFAINPELTKAGFRLPAEALDDPQYHGKSAEWIYSRLPVGQESNNNEQGQPDGDPGDQAGDQDQGASDGDGSSEGQDQGGPLGEVREAPKGTEAEAGDEASEEVWKQAVRQAANSAKARGKLPGSLQDFADTASAPTVDWRPVLWRFAQDIARDDYSWSAPNRRYISQGLYLPSLHSEGMGPLAFGIDVSGSIDTVTRGQFQAELKSVVEVLKPLRLHVFYTDTQVQFHDVFERGEEVTFRPASGGGTDFRPVFEAVSKLDEQPACIVYLTDLMGAFPDVAPDVPTLWAATELGSVPFGEVVPVTS